MNPNTHINVYTTLALVLNGCNSSFLSPIQWSWHCCHMLIHERGCSCHCGAHVTLESISGFEFLICEISKLVYAKLVRLVSSIVKCLDALHVFLEYLVFLLFLVRVQVEFSMCNHPLLVHFTHWGILKSASIGLQSTKCKSKKQNQSAMEQCFEGHGSEWLWKT